MGIGPHSTYLLITVDTGVYGGNVLTPVCLSVCKQSWVDAAPRRSAPHSVYTLSAYSTCSITVIQSKPEHRNEAAGETLRRDDCQLLLVVYTNQLIRFKYTDKSRLFAVIRKRVPDCIGAYAFADRLN